MNGSGLVQALESLKEGDKAGLDIGSRSTKLALVRDARTELFITDTASFLPAAGGLSIPEGCPMVTTGYGRRSVRASLSIPEVRAHALGAYRCLLLPDFTLLDIGGQDFKVVHVKKGAVVDFGMNDKCAAGTGRFLEKMSDMLGMPLDELGAAKGRRKVLESTCSVFTETELITLMMKGVPKQELAGGVIYSVFERIRPYLRMFPSKTLVLTGGVSACSGLTGAIEESMGARVIVPANAQHMGAIGCAHHLSRRRPLR